MAKLTEKQMKFASAYLELNNATEAYKAAYDTQSHSSAIQNGYRLLKKPEIQAIINKAKAKNVDRAAITVESLVDDQTEAMQMAKLSGNAVAFAAASMNKAKLLGLLIERQAVMTATVNMNELAPDLAKIWGRAKLVLPRPVTPDNTAPEIASDYKDIEE